MTADPCSFYHRLLNLVPCAIPQDFVVYSSYIYKFASANLKLPIYLLHPSSLLATTSLFSMSINLKNSAVAIGLDKSIFIPIPKKGNGKECSNYHTIAVISNTSKVMIKILQARLQQYMNCELPDVQAGFRKDKGTSNCQHPLDHQKSKSFRKTATSASLTMTKSLTV